MNWRPPPSSDNDSPILCARCLRLMEAGRGDFFVVKIEAVSDPSPPRFEAYEVNEDVDSIRQGQDELVEQLSHLSEQEAKDQVYRRLEVHLCNDCFATWIENPAGEGTVY